MAILGGDVLENDVVCRFDGGLMGVYGLHEDVLGELVEEGGRVVLVEVMQGRVVSVGGDGEVCVFGIEAGEKMLVKEAVLEVKGGEHAVACSVDVSSGMLSMLCTFVDVLSVS